MSMKVKIELIERDAGTQSREMIDEETVAEYAQAMRDGAVFDAVIVYKHNGDLFLADGFHRVAAAELAGFDSIDADLLDGTREDAAWASAGSNVRHGRRRTNADKRTAVALALKARPDSSDRAIADHCGVSPTLVGEMRGQVSNLDTCGAGATPARTGRDGKRYPCRRTPQEEAAGTDDSPSSTGPIRQPAVTAAQAACLNLCGRRQEIETMVAAIDGVITRIKDGRESGDPLYAAMDTKRALAALAKAKCLVEGPLLAAPDPPQQGETETDDDQTSDGVSEPVEEVGQ